MVDSSVGSMSEADFESMVGSGSVLGMQVDSDSTHSVTEEFFLPTILQSDKGNFKHYGF